MSTLTLIPSLVTWVIAASPSCVAGILTNRLSRSTALRNARAMPEVAPVSRASRGSTSMETRPSLASGLLVHGSQDVAGRADVVSGDGEDRGVHVGALVSEVTQLRRRTGRP